jgi:hypothetical protein
VTHVTRAKAAVETAARIVLDELLNLLCGRRPLDKVIELHGRPVRDERVKEALNDWFANVGLLGNAVKDATATENAKSGPNQQRLRRDKMTTKSKYGSSASMRLEWNAKNAHKQGGASNEPEESRVSSSRRLSHHATD